MLNDPQSGTLLLPPSSCRSVIHLSNNKIEDPDCLEIFKKMPNLRCLYLQGARARAAIRGEGLRECGPQPKSTSRPPAGNPIVSNTRHYRKSLIASIKTLSYLDDRPVFELERLCAEAWAEGGLEAERAARAKVRGAVARRCRCVCPGCDSHVTHLGVSSVSLSTRRTRRHATAATSRPCWRSRRRRGA